ncbi:MAG: radical SAM protein [Candidatus Moranbacteria bacterium]|nr:radical SAM protein [Candidatus Moranbacteria bacterium]
MEEVFEREESLIDGCDNQQMDFFSKENLKTDEFPAMVQVGVSNLCNLSCAECYHRVYKKRPGYKPTFMSMKIFEKVIHEMASFPSNSVLRFLGKGESLLHPNIIEMVMCAKNKIASPVALITNGISLNRKMSVSMLGTGIDVLDISMDAFTSGTYGTVRSNPELFNMLVDNVNYLVALRDAGGFQTKVFVSFLMQPENFEERVRFEKYWSGRVDKILYRKYHTYGGKICQKPTLQRDRIPCAALWNRINVNERGLVTRCFVDWDDQYIIGDLNAKDLSLLKIWTGESFKNVRKEHQDGMYTGLCEKCEGWQTAHWNISYEKAIEMSFKKG